MRLLSWFGSETTAAGNRYTVQQRWGVAGDWIWAGGGQRGTAATRAEAVMLATAWADQLAPVSRRRTRGSSRRQRT